MSKGVHVDDFLKAGGKLPREASRACKKSMETLPPMGTLGSPQRIARNMALRHILDMHKWGTCPYCQGK